MRVDQFPKSYIINGDLKVSVIYFGSIVFNRNAKNISYRFCRHGAARIRAKSSKNS